MLFKKNLKIIQRHIRRINRGDIGHWQCDNRLRVAIQCTDHFTKRRWLKNIEDTYPNIAEHWQVQYYYDTYEKELLAQGMDVVFTFSMSRAFVDMAKELKWVFIAQSGVEFLEGEKYNFTVKTASGFSSDAIAEYVVCTTLVMLRRINHGLVNQSKRIWTQSSFLNHSLELLSTKTVGILGLGNNGRAIANIFKRFGCRVLGYDRRIVKLISIDQNYSCDQLSEIITQSHILVICMPRTAETEDLIGIRELQMLGCNGLLVNVARAEIVNEEDLAVALRKGIIGGAILDVFRVEPLPRCSPLWGCPNILITPHIAGNVNYFADDIQSAFLRELKKSVENC